MGTSTRGHQRSLRDTQNRRRPGMRRLIPCVKRRSKLWVTSWQELCERDRRSGAGLAEDFCAKYVPKSAEALVAVQVRARLRAVCKTVGSAYVGSNPTPATTCENGPLAANCRARRAVLLVPVCVITCHRGPSCCGVHGRMADGVRALGRSVCTVGVSRTATDGPRWRGFRAWRARLSRACIPGAHAMETPGLWRAGGLFGGERPSKRRGRAARQAVGVLAGHLRGAAVR